MARKNVQKQNKPQHTLTILMKAVGIIYAGCITIGILQYFVGVYLQWQTNFYTVAMKKQLHELTKQDIQSLMHYSNFNGMILLATFLLLVLLYLFAGWYVMRRMPQKALWYSAIPAVIVILAGVVTLLLGFGVLGQFIKYPNYLFISPAFYVLPIVVSLLGGLYAKHVTVRIK